MTKIEEDILRIDGGRLFGSDNIVISRIKDNTTTTSPKETKNDRKYIKDNSKK